MHAIADLKHLCCRMYGNEPSSSSNAYDGRRGPNSQNVMLGPPDRWMFCPKIGKVLFNTFLPFKTPLCSLYDKQIEKDGKHLVFHPEDVFNCSEAKGRKIGLWIDLTKTERFYWPSDVESRGCKYRKIKMAGHGASPTEDEVSQFIRLVSGYLKDNPNDLVAVHCTHGFNRTGFCIVSFMVASHDLDVSIAIQKFSEVRSPGIYKQEYILDLFKRFGDEEDALEAPQKPSWEFGEESSSTGQGVEGSQGGSNGAVSSNGASVGGKVFADGKIPDVQLVTDKGLKEQLQSRIKEYCKFDGRGFPGSQPVSMERSPERDNISFLAHRRYMVSWKADGSRYLMLIAGPGEIFAFDRDNEVFLLPRLTFPGKKDGHVRDTLVDCELIFDVDPSGHEFPRLLIYDIITFQGFNLGKENFEMRFKCIKDELMEPREAAAKTGQLNKARELCSVRRKDFWNVNTVRKILSPAFTKNVGHEIDGLIFQPIDEPYIPGRCDTVLKWKPPSHNSIDYKLQITKVQKPGELAEYVGRLFVQHLAGPFAEMKATKSLQPYDGKIIECRFNSQTRQWEFMRERTDKSLPNAVKTAEAVWNSMQYPIPDDALCTFVEQYYYRGPPHPVRPLSEYVKKPEKRPHHAQNGGGKRPRREEKKKGDIDNGGKPEFAEQRRRSPDMKYDEEL